MTINVNIADGDPGVGFQLFQELSEAREIRLSGCLDHARWYRATAVRKVVFHHKVSSSLFFTNADRDGRAR
jgi:hypothetical protein